MIKRLISSLFILTLFIGCSKTGSNYSTEKSDSGARGVFRGITISKEKNPAVGAVLITYHSGNQFLCSGSLVSSNVVLTAAHCFLPKIISGQEGKKIIDEIESILFSFDAKLSRQSRLIPVIALKINPDYRPDTNVPGVYDSSADTALLKLALKFHYIEPLKIVEEQPLIPNTGLAAKIVGYGANDTRIEEELNDLDIPGSGTVPEFKINLIDIGAGIKRRGDITFTKIVNGVGKGNTNQPFVVAPDEFLVTPNLVGTDSPRSCHGDSGGPAMIKVNGKYQIVGIVAGGFGDFCALSSRGFYTNMVKYKAWVEKTIEALNPITGACTFEDSNFRTEGGGCKQIRAQLVWAFVPRKLMTKDQAKSYCDNLVEGGHDDWRLPTVSELQRLAAFGTSHLDISRAQIPGTLWSNNIAYSVNSYSGRSYPATYYPNQFVACVRK